MKTVKSATSRAATAVVVLCGHLATVVLWSVIVGGSAAAAAEDPSIRSGEGQRYAVLIGVEQYRQVPPLVFVINDVEQIGGTLADRGGYQVWRFVETAADTAWHPTRENLLKHLPELLQRPREQDKIMCIARHARSLTAQMIHMCQGRLPPRARSTRLGEG